MWYKLQKILPLRLELITFLLVVFIIGYTAVNYSRLPETIPTHFNFQGTADGWGGKGSIFIYAGMGIFVYLLMTGISLAFSVIRDPRVLINLPASVKERITPAKAEELRIFMIRSLYALKLTILAMNTFLVFGNIQMATGNWTGLGYWPMLFIPIILAIAFLMVFRSMRIAYSK